MNTQLIVELVVIGTIVVIGFLAIKLGLTQDTVKIQQKAIKSLETINKSLESDYSSLYGKYLNGRKEIKRLSSMIPKEFRECRTKKDLNTALNEMNKHSGKRVIDSLEEEFKRRKCK